MIKKKDLSEVDKKAWENYIKNPSDIFDKDKTSFSGAINRGRFIFDLHGFTLDQANKKVKEIILSCINNKYKEILIVTGKGIHSKKDQDIYTSKNLGKLRYSVPEFINSDQELNKLIVSIQVAAAIDGGEGAILIKLKNL